MSTTLKHEKLFKVDIHFPALFLFIIKFSSDACLKICYFFNSLTPLLFLKVWRRGCYLFCTCPYWLLGLVLSVIRHQSEPQLHPVNGHDETRSKLTIRFIITWMGISLSAALLLVDTVTSFQVKNR